MNNTTLQEISNTLRQESYILFAYIFGSLAEGSANEYSDVDIAIYIKDSNMGSSEYIGLKRKLMDIAKRDVDLVILNEASPLLKNQIFKYGIVLFSKNKELESNFKVHSIFEYQDMRKYYELSYNAMIDTVRKEVEVYGKS